MICTLERERERERERGFIFDLQNLVVTLANACHEIISNSRVTALTLNTFVQTLISHAHAHAASKNIILRNIISITRTIVSKQVCDRASND